MFSHQAMQTEGGHFSTDFHMPDFDGFEGFKDIEQEFELHDIMSENNGDPRLEGFELHDIMSGNNNDHNVVIQGGHSDNSGFEITQQGKNNNVESKKDEEHNIDDVIMSMSSRKIRWTGPLHTRFLKAVNIIGLHKLTPKKVLKLMNVPDLTRRNVASHLQKYRLFLKRFADKNFPEIKDRETALNAAFLKTMPVLNLKQHYSDISIPYPLSFFRAMLEWRRASFSDYTDGFYEPVYIDPSVTSSSSNRGSNNKLAPGTHFNGAVLPPMHNHDQNVSCGPRNHATPFNMNPNNNGMTHFFKPPQVNGNATVFGSDQGKLGGQGIYTVNGFETSCFDAANGATVISDHITIPSSELGQAHFSSNITQEEQPFGSFSAVNNNMLYPQQSLGLLVPSLEPGPISTSVIGAGPLTPPQSQPSKYVFDDDVMWNDEFMTSLLDDIRPLLED